MHRVTTQFNGGISQNSKVGVLGSFRFARNLNIYTDDDSVTLNPKLIKVSGSTVTDLVRWATDVYPTGGGDKYFLGDTGNIYKDTSSETWTVDRSGATIGNGAAGQGLGFLDDALYYATATTLGRKYPLSGTPAYADDFLTNDVDNLDLDENSTAAANTYTTPVAISEVAADTALFTPTKDPLKTISLWIVAKGTGNVTVTVHDALNNNLGSATITNGSLTNGAYNDFTFATPIRINIGQEYHFHATSTVADATVRTVTASTLADPKFQTLFGILISDTLYHPIAQHTNGVSGTIVIGNANYIAEWTGIAYQPNKIEIRPGYTIRYFTRENEFIVAMAWKGTTIDAYEDGMAFYWDGIQPYYNYSIPITTGTPNASVNFKNRIFSILGTNGQITLETQPFRLIQPAPLLARGKTIEVLPGAITVWQNKAHIGLGANSTDATGVYQGVYEFGNQSDRALSVTSVSTEVLNLGYTISTGDVQGTTMKIGCVYAQGAAMYVGWKSEAGTFGVDKVLKSNDPAASGSYESLIDDFTTDPKTGLFVHAPQKQKEARRLTIKYNTLPTGCTVTPKFKIDRGSWEYGTGGAIGVAGTVECEIQINRRYFEIEYGFDLVATTGFPVVTGMYYSFDPKLGERNNM